MVDLFHRHTSFTQKNKLRMQVRTLDTTFQVHNIVYHNKNTFSKFFIHICIYLNKKYVELYLINESKLHQYSFNRIIIIAIN